MKTISTQAAVSGRAERGTGGNQGNPNFENEGKTAEGIPDETGRAEIPRPGVWQRELFNGNIHFLAAAGK